MSPEPYELSIAQDKARELYKRLIAKEKERERQWNERSAVHERAALSGLLFARDMPRRLEFQRTLGDTACLEWWPPECQLEHSDLCAECQELNFKQAFHPPLYDDHYPLTENMRLRDRLYKRDTGKYTHTIRDSRGSEWLVNDPNCRLCLCLVTARCRRRGKPEVGEYYILFHNKFETEDSRNFRQDLGFDQSSLFQVYLSVLYPPLDGASGFPDIYCDFGIVICHIGKPIRMGRALQIVPPHFQALLAIAWLKECKINHSAGLDEDKLPIPRTRLIHCETRKLVSINPDNFERPHYAALSYVWGGNPKPTNVPKDDLLPDVLPLTINDALIVTRAIGLQYLWVDQYCIDQNDPADKKRQIRQMDLIYKCADVTIIAATGDSRDHGLPGVSRPRNDIPYPFSLNFNSWSLTFGVSQREKYYWRDGKWRSRGWTFQEALLSKRRLIFSDTAMHFECNHGGDCSEYIIGQAKCAEVQNGPRIKIPSVPWPYISPRRCSVSEQNSALSSDDVLKPWSRSGRDRSETILGDFTLSKLRMFASYTFAHILDPFMLYIQLAMVYTTRELTDPADGLNAFRGAANALQRSDKPVYNVAGIPFVLPADQEWFEFDWAGFTFSTGLSWDSRAGSSTPAAKFPTWSWGNVRVWNVTWRRDDQELELSDIELHGIENTLYFPRDMRIEFDQDGLKKVYTLPQFARACRDPGLDVASISEAVPASLWFQARILSARLTTKPPSLGEGGQQGSEQGSGMFLGTGGSDFENGSWDMNLLVHVNESPADESTTKSDRVHKGDHSRWHCELRVDDKILYEDLEAEICDLVLLNCDKVEASVLVIEWLGKPEDRPRAARRSGIVRFELWRDDHWQFFRCFSIEKDLKLV